MSKLADVDDGVASRTLALIWDACSDMSRHLQAKFAPDVRDELFGRGWDRFRVRSFDDVADALRVAAPDITQDDRTLISLLAEGSGARNGRDGSNDEELDRYGSIIDFSNFLLHVLALAQPARSPFSWSGPSAVPLDDKQLVALFEQTISTAEQVRDFAYALLRARYLFDQYVIKTDRSRESEDDSNWVLLRARKLNKKLSPISTFGSDGEDESATSEEHEHVVMLQSMFQVTDSRRSYKNFLYALLEHLYDSEETPEAATLVTFLQRLAESRFETTVGLHSLDQGTSTSHFAFNYLDYLLWRRLKDGTLTDSLRTRDITYKQYRFRYRSSVEHFYPQHPDPSGNITRLPQDTVDRFGNLCLMSRSENTRRSNLAPGAKINQYRSEQQSLKFQLMAAHTKASGWDVDDILSHGDDMRTLLAAGLGWQDTSRERWTV